ncbi:MAG: 5'/3'-nucleotidase SurE [Candidatus Krumholzibacteria bacterium]|nr:5'/3'-nucleotidase SurE [Candidatus Krumholzibacteria bacterium]
MEKTILITNDDGIRASGLETLESSLSGLGKIILVAPENEQSATSHAITLDRPLRIKKYSENRYSVTGTPTDCVLLAVHGILGSRPDLVVSGINHGPNMGEDVTYSGTVAAAIEGNILGIDSIAISITSWDPASFEASGKVSRYLASRMLEREGKHGTYLLNVNIPPLPEDKLRGLRITKLGSRVYNDSIVKKTDPRGKDYFWIGGGEPGWNIDEKSDFTAVSNDYISVTPLKVDMTDYKSVLELEQWKLDWRS